MFAILLITGCGNVNNKPQKTEIEKLSPTITVKKTLVPRPSETITPTKRPTLTHTCTPSPTFTPSQTPSPTITPIGGGSGKIFFFRRENDQDAGELYSISANGENLNQITINENVLWGYYDYSPQESAFVYQNADGIWIRYNEIAEAIKLLPSEYVLDSWLPDGNTVLVSKNYAESFLLNIADGELTQVTTDEYDAQFFTLSPDQTKLAFASRKSGRQRIYVIGLDGNTDPIQITHSRGPEGNWYPVWSPDSTKIIFTSCSSSGCNIGLVNADGTDETTIGKNLSPAGAIWLDDETIIFRKEYSSGVGFAISRINIDGTGEVDLITDRSFGITMALSPDKRKILFLGDCHGTYTNCDLFVANIDGSEVQKITNSLGYYRNMMWQR